MLLKYHGELKLDENFPQVAGWKQQQKTLPTIPGVAPASQMETTPSPAEHAERDAKRAQRKHAKPVETKSKKKKA